MIPAFFSPIKAIKNPIPAPIASFNCWGIALIIALRTPVTEINKKIIPDTTTAANAAAGLYPIEKTRVYVNNALTPIPGAKATG